MIFFNPSKITCSHDYEIIFYSVQLWTLHHNVDVNPSNERCLYDGVLYIDGVPAVLFLLAVGLLEPKTLSSINNNYSFLSMMAEKLAGAKWMINVSEEAKPPSISLVLEIIL